MRPLRVEFTAELAKLQHAQVVELVSKFRKLETLQLTEMATPVSNSTRRGTRDQRRSSSCRSTLSQQEVAKRTLLLRTTKAWIVWTQMTLLIGLRISIRESGGDS